MRTELQIDGTQFLINNTPTYAGRQYRGRSIEGLLLNSRMVQAVFDDQCPETRSRWAYPDTGVWDPERNTDEFCAQLPEYRRHGLLAVTVGLQGGGSVYTPEIYQNYNCAPYAPDGEFRPAYFKRLERVLNAADEAGMVVIVNYFYRQHVRRIESDDVVRGITERVTAWLLASGYRNIIVDVANEANPFWKRALFAPDHIHELVEIAQGVQDKGRRLPVAVSTAGGRQLPSGRWREIEDLALPHGNGLMPEQLAQKLRTLKDTDAHRARPRPIVVNEDSIFVENMEAAVAEGCSWGFYCQGYGSNYKDRMDWKTRDRETSYAELSGYQTLPVNWSINTEIKRHFFAKAAEITGMNEVA
jgi:hypothetical protein